LEGQKKMSKRIKNAADRVVLFHSKSITMADTDKDTVPTVQFESCAPQVADRAAKSIKVGGIDAASRKVLQETNKSLIIWPWNKYYISWWSLTVAGAFFTILTETYAIAFLPAGLIPYGDAASIIEYILVSIFLIDIVVNFRLVYYDDDNELVLDEKKIARHYLKGTFWRDFVGVFPFYVVALAITGELGQDSKKAQYLALLRLVKLVRLHRTKQLFDSLQYNTHVSLMTLTLIRNFCFALVWSHFSACVFYFIARQFDFDPDDTWIGGTVNGRNDFERYVTALYWSVVTVRKRMLCVECVCMFHGANKLTMLRLSSCFLYPFAFSKPF
jgi:hypothetical protein